MAERLQELVNGFTAQGINSTTTAGETTFTLRAYGCPYYGLAQAHPEMCALETTELLNK